MSDNEELYQDEADEDNMLDDGNGHSGTGFYPGYPNGEPSGNLSLDQLQDPPAGTKPRYPYSTLIRYAIKGSPQGRLLLEDIYYALETRFPYFKQASNGWKNSVRHNLSLNPCFVKIPRPLTDRGKGSYWALDETIDPSNHRTGVHRVRRKRSERGAEAHGTSNAPGDTFTSGHYPYMSGMVMAPDQTPQTYGYGFHTTFMPPEMRFGMDGTEGGDADWRTLWMAELSRLEDYTREQDAKEVNQDWYRMMYYRVVRAFAPDPNQMYAQGMVAQQSAPGTSGDRGHEGEGDEEDEIEDEE